METFDIDFDPEEHFRKLEFLVDPGQSPLRIDRYLIDKVENTTRNKIQMGIKLGAITVNGKWVKSNYKVRPKDHIHVMIPKHPESGKPLQAQNIPLDIIYEDDSLLVLNKQSGLVVHPGVSNWDGTLVNGLLHHLKEINFPIKEGNLADRPGLVHRIDKDTSGLMVIAKTEEAMTHLAKQFYEHTIDREYQALVWGSPEPENGTIDAHIGRNPKNRLEMTVVPDASRGKHAITHYETIRAYYYVTLISCRLETGRTHQIRTHLKHIGHPIFNDARYGGDVIRKGTAHKKYKQFIDNCFRQIPRQALHARKLGFVHPVTKEKMEFSQELPEDFQGVMDRWENYLSNRLQDGK